MVLSVGPVSVGNEVMLYSLLALIPFFIIYLIRPRPKQLNIPSLMFLFKSTGISRFTSFLRNFVRDWVFLIQLLALLVIICSLLAPYFFYDHDITSKNTVIVIDASASSQTYEGSRTRFQIAIEKAKEVLGGRNTVIIAKEIPLIGIQDVLTYDASSYLNRLQPSDTTTRLGDAIILAGEVLAGKEGRVVVLSDFINTGGQSPETARSILESKGIVVDFIDTAGEWKDNIGFIDLAVAEDKTIAYVKNFGREQKTVVIESGDSLKEMTLNPGEVKPYSFATPKGVTEFRLPNDAFPVDNKIYVSGPPEESQKILIISNTQSVFLENALKATPFVEVDTASPPIVPTEGYDIFVLHNINPSEILPGTMESIHEKVTGGRSIIIHAQKGMGEIDYKGLLPLTIHGFTQQGPVITEQSTTFTRNIDFGIVERAYNVSREEMTVVSSVQGSPVVSTGKIGAGKVIYFGIEENASDFRLSPAYPIFWHELLSYITEKEDIQALNFNTGRPIILDKKYEITTPRGTVTRSTLILEYVGEYAYRNKRLTSNLISEAESSINFEGDIGEQASKYKLQPVKERRKYELEKPLLIAALAILFLELLFIKMRGDI